ncbi:thioredoxin family protein [Marinilongibacter aquaticus]|uniref:thioredoxin family protein n=1 Tax=Marinilongibacter aquaticus TaxID=2975157 RepID=UPI0021BDBE8A|nr:thioredoxin family protein [Marinilongibacter aquaticus]UBM57542.1 thioredoxin family protein [Marinilongibacter aquaticus]
MKILIRNIAAVLFVLGSSAFSKAFSQADGYGLGDVVEDFNLANIDGRKISMASFAEAKGFIVVFTCNHCPFSKTYEDRIVALDNKFASKGFPVLAVNSNDPQAYEEDNLVNMKKRATEKGFRFPYLVDDQGLGQRFGATRTPQVFVLKRENGQAIVKYTGAIDDNAQDSAAVNKRYVEDAVDHLLQDKPVIIQSTRAIGCSIKWRE